MTHDHEHDHDHSHEHDHTHEHDHSHDHHHDAENPHAGQGAVVLDIGGEIGALIVTVPADRVGIEVDIEPLDDTDTPVQHVAVVARPLPDGRTSPTLVYGHVRQGRYRLRVRPDGPAGPEVSVTGGEVTTIAWDEH